MLLLLSFLLTVLVAPNQIGTSGTLTLTQDLKSYCSMPAKLWYIKRSWILARSSIFEELGAGGGLAVDSVSNYVIGMHKGSEALFTLRSVPFGSGWVRIDDAGTQTMVVDSIIECVFVSRLNDSNGAQLVFDSKEKAQSVCDSVIAVAMRIEASRLLEKAKALESKVPNASNK